MKDLNPDQLAAIRHAVYRELLWTLPVASSGQTVQFIANLALARRNGYNPMAPAAERQKCLDVTLREFLSLKVTPDIATPEAGGRGYGRSRGEIIQAIADRFGDLLKHVAGFYKAERWNLNLPERCALYGYKSRLGFYAGILCQPLDQINKYFLLSSAGYGGEKAAPLTPLDRLRFETWRTSTAVSPAPDPTVPDVLQGYHYTGRRFVEPRATK